MDSDEQIDKCQTYVEQALSKTINEFEERLANIYDIQRYNARQAVTAALLKTAIAYGVDDSNMDEDGERQLYAHMHYLMAGARDAAGRKRGIQ